MQVVSSGDNLHEMSKHIFWKNNKIFQTGVYLMFFTQQAGKVYKTQLFCLCR